MGIELVANLSQTTQLALVLLFVVVIASLTRLFKQPLLIGYLIAGVWIGTVGFSHSLDHGEGSFFALFSELGISLLLFLVGLGLNPATIKEHGKTALGVGIIQIGLCTLLGFVLDRGLGFSWQSSLLIAAAMSFSSTIVIVKLLNDTQDSDSLYGRISIGVLIVQDIVAMLLLMLVALRGSGGEGGGQGTVMIVEGIGLLASVVAVSKRVMPHVLPRMAQTHELMLLIGIGWCLLLGSLFQGVGFSYEIGCLLAGMSFAVSPRRRAMMEKLQPLRDFFIVIFFVHLGMLVDVSVVGEYFREIGGLLFFVVAVKPALTYFVITYFGYTKKVAFKTATTLGQMSEFGLILLTLGAQRGLVESSDLVSVVMIVALLSILVSGYVITHNHRLTYRWLSLVHEEDLGSGELLESSVDVIVVGYGKFGHRIAHLLREQGVRVGIMETNPQAYAEAAKHGYTVCYADATNEESIRECFGSKSKMLISTIREFDDDWIIAHHVKKINPSTVMVALTLHEQHAAELYDAGCDYVVLPYHISAYYVADLIEELQYDLARFSEKKTQNRELVSVLLST